MNMNGLRTFVLAAESENYRMVAEQLFVTQPTVTFQIRQIEEELGQPLFERTGRNIALSEFGRKFYPEAIAILSHHQNVLDKMARYKQGYTDSLTVAISPLLAETVFPSILRKFMKQHPELELSIQVIESSQIASAIDGRAVDVGLSCLPSAIPSVCNEKVHEERISLVCSHDGYDAESAPPIDPLELLQRSPIFTDNHPGYWQSLKHTIAREVDTYKMIRVTQSHIAKRFILEGMGVSFLPHSIIRRDVEEGRLLEAPLPFESLPKAETYVLYKYLHSKEKAFISYIADFHI
ncbi:LysR family transcriptional regulator [Thalassobacillus sp. CUG 92003]|uniref:LysR family transcriptional regulator n=1 Tax=Thalassobacillus sp. CUG 92003 TaxID=2736641 RepID=UPI0015E73152|nr:LysR family transcriptional regulator [Thalassobacillus sp. CUG 92003]